MFRLVIGVDRTPAGISRADVALHLPELVNHPFIGFGMTRIRGAYRGRSI